MVCLRVLVGVLWFSPRTWGYMGLRRIVMAEVDAEVDMERYIMANPATVTIKMVHVRRAKWRLYISYLLLWCVLVLRVVDFEYGEWGEE